MNKRNLATLAIFLAGCLVGSLLSVGAVQARYTPSTAFKKTPEVLGILVEQNGQTQDILDRLEQNGKKQAETLAKMHQILQRQLDEQKRIHDQLRDLKDIVKRK